VTASVTSAAVWSTTSSAAAVLTRSLLRGPARGDDVGAGRFGQLHGVAADCSARAVDQHTLPGGQPAVVEERLPRGEADQRQRGGVGQRDARGRSRQGLGR
jgi:hypothetical protein